MSKHRITSQTFYKYLLCPHWIWFDIWGDQKAKGELSELQQKLLEQGIHREEEYIKDRDFVAVELKDPEEAFLKTLELMKQGTEAIWQGVLIDDHWVGRPDLLERRKGKSRFGSWYYAPVDIKSSNSLKREHKLQLVLYALLLEKIQTRRPKEACIINRAGERICFEIDDFTEQFECTLKEIEGVLENPKPPLPFLTKKCLESPWGSECIRLAEECDDIALLYRVSRRVIGPLREAGIKTLEDVRRMNPKDVAECVPYLTEKSLERMKMQAESLKTKKWFLRKHQRISDAEYKIYFDIEGDPLYGCEYLFGFLVESPEVGVEYVHFLAERPEDEEKMWNQFLEWVETLPKNYIVFHFASYEKGRITMLSNRYGGSAALNRFYDNLFDIYDVITSCLVLPVYFYGLKDIAKLLGFEWRHKKAGGAQSIFWYEDWLIKKDRKILKDIVQYNEDDVRATKFMKEWLVEAMKEEVGEINPAEISERVTRY